MIHHTQAEHANHYTTKSGSTLRHLQYDKEWFVLLWLVIQWSITMPSFILRYIVIKCKIRRSFYQMISCQFMFINVSFRRS